MTPHPPQPGIVVRWRPRKLKFAMWPYFNIIRDIMEKNSRQLFSKINHAQNKCLTLVPKMRYTRKHILAYNRLWCAICPDAGSKPNIVIISMCMSSSILKEINRIWLSSFIFLLYLISIIKYLGKIETELQPVHFNDISIKMSQTKDYVETATRLYQIACPQYPSPT